MSKESPTVGFQAAARERAIADLGRSATQVCMLAVGACPDEATMRFVLRFGHHLQTLYGLSRGVPAKVGEQPGTQPSGPKPAAPPKEKLKPKMPSPQGNRVVKEREAIAANAPKARPLAETLAFLQLSSRLISNHNFVKDILKTIDRTKLSKKLLKVVVKVDQNLLLTTSRGGKIYASEAQRKYAQKLRRKQLQARKGKMEQEEDEPKQVEDLPRQPQQATFADGPAEEEEFEAHLRGWYLEIKNDRLFEPLGLDSRLHEQTPVDDNLRLAGLLWDSPLGEVTKMALAFGMTIRQVLQTLGEGIHPIREKVRQWSAKLIKPSGSGV